ncbi:MULTISPECIES: sugar ABC transporter substrate-binding protein [unclassified Rhizobium]|jgi:simple sugar transport system substrate-binding protein|uniref:sugar ABC transporter substrate-binding protein n=1 Tax=unclassified Rhizobium TaxID=2613769 RepID=UPI0006470606|nr:MULTISPECIES: sugar ABC transporter substrate-binding protein [unclassified Rhizobium]MBN8953585.1 sugar ABC transporter substrate-binding protein [Rhizobium tropici]OJY79035.1 MAG: ABC transporter substrate-binding protein [Rhizobium sp. 60-20]RKD67765.1 monosaccharide ABC transporter substrate-binding protein (CUT2 family) [Rhizobium sp. WW_1]
MLRKLIAGTALGLSLMASGASAAGLNITFISHSSASNTFWQSVKKGFDDACTRVEASCQLVLTQTEGSVEQAVANLQAAIATKPDAIFVAIVDDKAYDAAIKEATDAGILVLAVNVDDSQGAKGNARKAFIGQGFVAAGYSLAKAQSLNFPKDGPLNLLVGVNAPGQTWSEQRAAGVTKFLEEYKAEHKDREVNIARIDSATDLAVAADRIGAYLNANPNTTAYFDTGYWDAGVAKVLKDRGIKPGKVLLGGFDLVPEVLQQMTAGYVQVQVDQQPYMQGFMPVMEAYLWKTAGLTPSDIDTGQGIVTPKDVPMIMEMSKRGLR